MKKVYKYENSVVIVKNCNNSNLGNIQLATEQFLRKVLKERTTNGNGYTSRDICEK